MYFEKKLVRFVTTGGSFLLVVDLIAGRCLGDSVAFFSTKRSIETIRHRLHSPNRHSNRDAQAELNKMKLVTYCLKAKARGTQGTRSNDLKRTIKPNANNKID